MRSVIMANHNRFSVWKWYRQVVTHVIQHPSLVLVVFLPNQGTVDIGGIWIVQRSTDKVTAEWATIVHIFLEIWNRGCIAGRKTQLAGRSHIVVACDQIPTQQFKA